MHHGRGDRRAAPYGAPHVGRRGAGTLQFFASDQFSPILEIATSLLPFVDDAIVVGLIQPKEGRVRHSQLF